MPSDESKGSQLDAIGSLAQRQLDNTIVTVRAYRWSRIREAIASWTLRWTLASDDDAAVTQRAKEGHVPVCVLACIH